MTQPLRRTRTLAGTAFELAGQAEAVDAACAWLVPTAWSKPDRGARREAIEVRVERTARGIAWWAPEFAARDDGRAFESIASLEYFLTITALARAPSAAALHAATLVRESTEPDAGDRARATVLIVGHHGAGKSTLSLALSQRGHRLFSDDVVLLDRDGLPTPFPRPLRVASRSVELIAGLGQRVGTGARVDRALGIHWIDPGLLGGHESGAATLPRVRHVVFARYARGLSTRLTTLDTRAAIPLALEQTFGAESRDLGVAQAIVSLFAHARAWRFEYDGPPSGAAALLDSTLRDADAR